MTRWSDSRERGNTYLIYAITWLAKHVGRFVCRLLLYPIVTYFVIAAPTARRASMEFLQAVYGRSTTWWDAFAHLYSFASTLLDRVYLAAGDFGRFEITIDGLELVDEALKSGRGCVLLGSHLGSFDLLALAHRQMGAHSVSIMMRVMPHMRLRRIAGIDDSTLNLIPLGQPDSYIQAFEALQRGGVVAILADRVEGAACLPVSFMNKPTVMPIAPHVLAARGQAPMLMCFGLYEGKRRYRIEFIDCGVAMPPGSKGVQFQPVVNHYTQILERYARRYPLNWFNFYPFWGQGGTGK